MNFRLPNGLEVVLEENHAAPVVAFQAWMKVGSASEPVERAGIAHFAEHMVFKGTQKRGVGQIAQEVEGAGGEINAWTSYDETAFHLVLASDYFDTGLDILADALQRSAFDAGELERERKVVLEEVKQGLDDPDRMAAQGLFETAFDKHPYGRPIIGSAATVGRITREDMLDFFRRYYVASNLTLVVVGDIDLVRARTAIEAAFGSMPAGELPPRPGEQPPQLDARVRAVARDVKESQLLLGFRGPEVGHADVPALDLLALILGQGESSRLNLEVVRRRKLVNAASSYTFAGRSPGLFVLGASLSPVTLEAATAALLHEVLRLSTEEVSREELAKSRAILESERVFDKETVQGYARKLGFFAAIAGDVDFERRYFLALQALQPADLKAIAARYLNPQTLTVLAQVPESKGVRRGQVDEKTSQRLRKVVAAATPKPARKSSARASAARPKDDVVTRSYRSGLRALVLRDPSVPIVAARATWVGGLRFEDAASNGISNLVAGLITRGTQTRTAEEIMQSVEGMAGSLSGYAGRNSLGVQAEFLSRHWTEGLELMADCLLHPTFPENELEHERRIVLDDLRSQEDSLSQVVFRRFHEAIWTRHPYRLDPLGSPASVKALTRRKLQTFFKQHYAPANMTFAVVGDVDPDAVLDRIGVLLDQRGSKPAAARKPPAEPPIRKPRYSERLLAREQAHLVLGYPGVTLDSPDRYALELLSQVLSGQGGRLFVEIRERRALAYRVSAFSLEGLDPGYFAVYVGTSPEKLDEALQSIRAELARLCQHGVGADELARAQRYLIGTHAIGLQRKSAIAAALAFHEAYGQGWRTYRQYAQRIGRIGVAELQRAAQKYLNPEREVIALVQPPPLAAVEDVASRKAARHQTVSPASRSPNRSPPR